MAFGDKISFSMWNHNMETQNIPDCHHDEENNNKDFGNCKSVCCYEKDYTTNNFLLSNTTQNIIKKFKILISFFDVWDLDNLVFDWNFVWNTSPPNEKILLKQDNLYINLIWIIKSNT